MTPSRILIVDDDTPSRIVVGRAIAKLGFAVDSAASAEDAKRFIQEHGPQAYAAAIADLRMPKVNGFEFLDWLYRVDPSIAAAMLTAQNDLELGQVRDHPSVRHVLLKPIDFSRTAEVVADLANCTVKQRDAEHSTH